MFRCRDVCIWLVGVGDVGVGVVGVGVIVVVVDFIGTEKCLRRSGLCDHFDLVMCFMLICFSSALGHSFIP